MKAIDQEAFEDIFQHLQFVKLSYSLTNEQLVDIFCSIAASVSFCCGMSRELYQAIVQDTYKASELEMAIISARDQVLN